MAVRIGTPDSKRSSVQQEEWKNTGKEGIAIIGYFTDYFTAFQ
jgi:hypothetical protein